jgi:predicted GTPase
VKDSKTITENRMRTYENFLQEKAALTVLVEQIGELAQHMDLGSESLNNFKRVKNIITNDAFRVIFVGSFSRGKSTTINALLGNQILPSKLAPATAISTVIRYGEEPKATVFFRDNTISPESMDIEDELFALSLFFRLKTPSS